MLQKQVPYYPLILFRHETRDYPRYALPEGYEFVFYKEGDEAAWAAIEISVGQFETEERAIACFRREFIDGQGLDPRERMLFVKDPEGDYVATAALWDGDFLGEKCQRMHWLAVCDKCAGKGIAKALLTRLMDLYNDLGYEGFVYLVTGTWSFPAVGIYRRFGFEEYRGPRSLSADMTDEQYVEQTEKAIAIIDENLARFSSAIGGNAR